ncbi:MAG: hypothetical protein HY320_09350 [Armatimonadetes bacterium]|nr:hypothetical protein [Armatimonadota bacterium]
MTEPIREEEQPIREHTRVLKVYRKVCSAPNCTREFEGPARQRYCSHTCGIRAGYWRNKERVLARQRERYRQHGRTKRGDCH